MIMKTEDASETETTDDGFISERDQAELLAGDLDLVEDPVEPVEDESPSADSEAQEETKNDTVPLATFLEKKNEVKSLQDEVAVFRHQLDEMNRFKMEFERRQQTQVEQEAAPKAIDYFEDPEGSITQRFQATQEALQEQSEKLEAIEQQRQQGEALTQFKTVLGESVRKFSTDNPDWIDAHKVVRGIKMSELQASGVTDEVVANQYIDQWELQFSYQAMADNANPAERIYNLAKTFGYAKASDGEQAAAQGNEKLKNIANGQKLNKNLGTGGAEKDVQDMDEDEFDLAFKKTFNFKM